MSTAVDSAVPGGRAEAYQHVMDRYRQTITYYWNSSRSNKRAYKTTRYLVVILGAVLTLISSITSADFIRKYEWLAILFAVLTPALAACLTIVSGFAQSFQWGAAWSNMALTAQRLEKERDRIVVTPPQQLNAAREMALLNETVLAESNSFFEKVLGSSRPTPLPEPTAAGIRAARVVEPVATSVRVSGRTATGNGKKSRSRAASTPERSPLVSNIR